MAWSHLKPGGLLSDLLYLHFCFSESVNPGAASGAGHGQTPPHSAGR